MRWIETLAADSATLHVYLREIAKFPRLTIEQERALGHRIRQRSDDEALKTLVEANLRFVVSYAKRYRDLGVPLLDLIHEGNLGLIEGARRFDPDRHVKVISCAVWWIRQSIMHLLAESSRASALQGKVAGAVARFGRDVSTLHGKLEHAPTMLEIDDESTRDAIVQELESAMVDLDPKERQVMRLRYGLHGGDAWTLRQLGDRLRVSRGRIRQIESRALQKVRRHKTLRSHLN